LKLCTGRPATCKLKIYILLSIKTRIETGPAGAGKTASALFISYYPLKQGLKHIAKGCAVDSLVIFISYYPLKQGLKHRDEAYRKMQIAIFISYYPLKQGLKHA